MKAVDGAQAGAEAQPLPAAPRLPLCKDQRDDFVSVGAEAAQVTDTESPVTCSARNGVATMPPTIDIQECESTSSSGKHLVNGDTHGFLKAIKAPSEKFRGAISKECITNMNLRLVSCNGSEVPEHKTSTTDSTTNGKLSDELPQSLCSVIQPRRKIQVPKDIFEFRNDDDYVMITLPGDKLNSSETGHLNGDSLPSRLSESKAVNGSAADYELQNGFVSNDATVVNHTQDEEGRTVEQEEIGSTGEVLEMKHMENLKESSIMVPRATDKDNVVKSMPDVICGSDLYKESNTKKRQDFAVKGSSVNCNNKSVADVKGPPVNCDNESVANGCSDETDFSKGSEEMVLSGSESPTSHWDRAVSEVKEQAIARLQEELHKAHQELKLRDEEVNRLSRIRQEVEGELEELTASLFQEAHNMVRAANVKQATAERSLKESQMQVEVLMAEVAALKTLVLTSTPSRPNPHLHPQIDTRASRSKDDATPTGVSLFNKRHRRSPSHYNLKYGRENSPPESPVKEQQVLIPEPQDNKDGWEVDPNIHKEFVAWKQNPKLEKSDPFIARIYTEDINLCLDFPNTELGAKVQEAVEGGTIFIEAVSDKSKTVFPKKCALLETPRQCHYRMKLGDQEQWHYISQICRNRIIAVCDFLNYLRYIERGLVKSSVHDIYWEITRLRKEMVLARLGLALSS